MLLLLFEAQTIANFSRGILRLPRLQLRAPQIPLVRSGKSLGNHDDAAR